MVQCSKQTFVCQVSNETDPNHEGFRFIEKSGKNHDTVFLKLKQIAPWFLFIFWQNKQTPWCNLLKGFKKIASWVLPDISLNQKPPWFGSVSFETKHQKVCFEHWHIFEGYLGAAIFGKQRWTFGQSLIFNVNFVNL